MVYRLSNPVLLLNGVATALWYVITAGSGQPFFCPNNAHKIVIIMAENQIIALTVQEAQEMYELVMAKDGQAVTSSLIVARYFKKQHKDVLKTIRMLDCSPDFRRRNIAPSCYTKTNGNVTKSYPMYYMTRDGFTFLAMGFTGRVAAQFKENYIRAFNEMEEALRKDSGMRYAEQLLKNVVENVNENLAIAIHNGKKRHGEEYGPAGDLQKCISYHSKETLERNLRNIFGQVGNAYMDGYFFAGQYRKAQEVIKRLNNVVDNYRDIIGELNAAITNQHDQAKRMQEQLLKSQEHTGRLLDIMAKKMK